MAEPELSPGGVFDSNWATATPAAALIPGTLYIVSVPIGNVEDVSIRALRVLQAVSVVAAESPPRTRAMLSAYRIHTVVTGLRPRSGDAPIAALIQRLRAGDTVALVCDAGTPLIVDLGSALVGAALRSSIAVSAIPGASAALAAYVIAGPSATRFAVDGFPPRSAPERSAYFASLGAEYRSIVLYETRSLLRDTLKQLCDSLGAQRAVFVGRDLTKPTETQFRGTLAEARNQFRNPPPGEFTIVVHVIAV